MKLLEKFRHSFAAFFEDFGYTAYPSDEYFFQNSTEATKIIFMHLKAYNDGLMIEFMLSISHKAVEKQLNDIQESKRSNSLQLSFSTYLDGIDDNLPRRDFIKKEESPDAYIAQIEHFFVKKGFYWLDEYVKSNKLNDLMALAIVQNKYYDNNLFLTCQRSLILKHILGEAITEDLFYTYYEILQEKRLPESKLKEFLELRMLFLA